ncbi:hypothetical protein LC048_01545 [Mesobacillus subterraneus]|nr:hypothetical protein [Mesobacillus subterraneus]WLR55725.1 hypothetical protein LC048_01545 [Mesobacillus subterraneus]
MTSFFDFIGRTKRLEELGAAAIDMRLEGLGAEARQFSKRKIYTFW